MQTTSTRFGLSAGLCGKPSVASNYPLCLPDWPPAGLPMRVSSFVAAAFVAAAFVAAALFLFGMEADFVRAQTKTPDVPIAAPKTDADGDLLPEGALARFGSSRFRFGGNVNQAVLSPDGKWLVANNGAMVLTLADAKSGKEVAQLQVPGNIGVSHLAFSPDNKHLAILGYSSQIQIIEIPSGKAAAKLQTNQQNARQTSLAFSGDGKTLVAGTDNFGQNKSVVN